jgi:hypothetical protein
MKNKSDTKTCKCCLIEQPQESFMIKRDKGKLYRMGKCKSCYSIERKPSAAKFRQLNKDKIREKYANQCPNKKRAKFKEYYLKARTNPTRVEKMRESGRNSYFKNRDKVIVQRKKYEQRPEVIAKRNETLRYRRTHDIDFILKSRLRYRLRHVLDKLPRGKLYKSKSAIELVGCDLDFLKSYIESKFTEGMSWDLVVNGEIQMDHIKPCILFDLKDIEQQKVCFHYSNLQPLWKLDNYKKNASYEGVYHNIVRREQNRLKK